MRPGKSGEDQFPGIGMAGFHLHLGDTFTDPFDPVDVGEIQLGIHIVGVHVEGEGDDIHIPGPFPVAEQGPFYLSSRTAFPGPWPCPYCLPGRRGWFSACSA